MKVIVSSSVGPFIFEAVSCEEESCASIGNAPAKRIRVIKANSLAFLTNSPHVLRRFQKAVLVSSIVAAL
jgi:hypothetical protein